MRARTRFPVLLLRRSEMFAFLRGVRFGFIFPGLLFTAAFWSSFYFSPPAALNADRTALIDATVSTPELIFQLTPFVRGDAALIVGSSETDVADPRFDRSLQEHLNGCWHSVRASQPRTVLSILPRGSGVRRAALLLERLRPHLAGSRTPVTIIVLDNAHYATNANQQWLDLRADFPDDASLLRHFARTPHSPFAAVPTYANEIQRIAAPGQAHHGLSTYLPFEIQILRAFLGRRIVQPLRRAFVETQNVPRNLSTPDDSATRIADQRDVAWGVARQYVPAFAEIAALRARKDLPEDLSNSVYGAAVRALAENATAILPPGSRLDVVILPLHRKFYERLGLNAGALERRRLTTLQKYSLNVRVAEPMNDPQLFEDSIHYTDAGRARLARYLCKSH